MSLREIINAHPRPATLNRDLLLRCADECLDCGATCTSCADACLGEEDVQALVGCIRRCLDCADSCDATARIVIRQTEPDLFLECSRRLNAAPEDCYVVGDAVWDLLAARRARMLSVGVLSGGYGEEELARAGAFQVYRDAEELRTSLDELGLLP